MVSKSRLKFVELAEKRVNKALKDIRLIGNLSNKSNYSYSEHDAKKILKVLKDEIELLKARFDNSSNASISSFKLDKDLFDE